MITAKRNKQHGSKSNNNNLQKWPFERAEENLCFLRGPLDCVTEAKNVNVCYNFDVRSHITAKRDNGSEESAYKWQNNGLSQTNMSPVCYM